MEHVIRFVRESENEQRASWDGDVAPITERELAGKLLAMRFFEAADVVLAKMYAEQDREAA